VRNIDVLEIRHYSLPGKIQHIIRVLRTVCGILRLSRKHRFVLIHTNTSFIFAGALAAKILRIPHVWHIHEIITQPKFWKVFSYLIPRLSSVVVAVSQAVKEHLVAGDSLNAKKTIVIHNGISYVPFRKADAKRVRDELHIDGKELLIGMVARVNWWKGQDVFLMLAKELLKTRHDLKFILVGGPHRGDDRSLASLHEEIRKSSLERSVYLLGYRRDIPDVMAALDIIIIPSTQPDPFPTVALEAMYSGKPVVSFSHGGIPEMMMDGMTSNLVVPVDLQGMAGTVRRLIDDPDLRVRLGRAGKMRCEEQFTSTSFIQKFEATYSDLLQDGH
jgi:glycosyltransferase involved in cell wall biosynthesis